MLFIFLDFRPQNVQFLHDVFYDPATLIFVVLAFVGLLYSLKLYSPSTNYLSNISRSLFARILFVGSIVILIIVASIK
jgi:hypothetical protein